MKSIEKKMLPWQEAGITIWRSDQECTSSRILLKLMIRDPFLICNRPRQLTMNLELMSSRCKKKIEVPSLKVKKIVFTELYVQQADVKKKYVRSVQIFDPLLLILYDNFSKKKIVIYITVRTPGQWKKYVSAVQFQQPCVCKIAGTQFPRHFDFLTRRSPSKKIQHAFSSQDFFFWQALVKCVLRRYTVPVRFDRLSAVDFWFVSSLLAPSSRPDTNRQPC